MNNEEKQPFTAPVMTLSNFVQDDMNTTSAMDVWSIREIPDLSSK